MRQFLPTPNFFQVEAEELPEILESTSEVEAMRRAAIDAFETYCKLNKKVSQEALQTVSGLEKPNGLSDTIAGHLAVKTEDKQALLETLDPIKRLERVLAILNQENEVLAIENRIKSRVKKQMEKTQREYYLNEQMRSIRRRWAKRRT